MAAVIESNGEIRWRLWIRVELVRIPIQKRHFRNDVIFLVAQDNRYFDGGSFPEPIIGAIRDRFAIRHRKGPWVEPCLRPRPPYQQCNNRRRHALPQSAIYVLTTIIGVLGHTDVGR
jgi:hypothetical protein